MEEKQPYQGQRFPHVDLKERIENDFAFHAANTEEKKDAHTSVRQHCKELALYLEGNVPVGRELSTALTKLEEVMMWSNAAIARNDKQD
jgi:hypothetical protein